MAKKQTLAEELQERLDLLIKKSEEAETLRGSIIKLQEDLIGELIEELNREKQRGIVSFKAGAFAGLVVGTIICMIINLVITVIR
jgi:hypothetical protein